MFTITCNCYNTITNIFGPLVSIYSVIWFRLSEPVSIITVYNQIIHLSHCRLSSEGEIWNAFESSSAKGRFLSRISGRRPGFSSGRNPMEPARARDPSSRIRDSGTEFRDKV